MVEEGGEGDARRPSTRGVSSVAEKLMFRDAFKERRCMISEQAGFPNEQTRRGPSRPHLFTAADGAPVLAFAGLWDRWRDPATREDVLSCTIIVSGASAWMEPYHDRMPVLLEEKDFDAWLDKLPLGPEALKPASKSALREWTVSPRLNRTGVGDDDPTIIEPVIAEPTAERLLLDKAAK